MSGSGLRLRGGAGLGGATRYDMLLESIQARFPKASVMIEPGTRCEQRFRFQA
jgi:hypothetical protein